MARREADGAIAPYGLPQIQDIPRFGDATAARDFARRVAVRVTAPAGSSEGLGRVFASVYNSAAPVAVRARRSGAYT